MVRVIAHRGFAGDNPENTLPAVRRAVEVTDAVEIDVRRCGSGEPVVIHDETVERVTRGSGRVEALSRDELASLSVLGTSAGVPTLAEVLDACPPNVLVHVELKEVGVVNDVVDLLRRARNEVVLSSFLEDALGACRDAGADVPLAYLHADGDGIARACDFGCTYVHPHRELVDRGYVERARKAGLGVNAWTVSEAHEARRLVEAGVDGIIADHAYLVDET